MTVEHQRVWQSEKTTELIQSDIRNMTIACDLVGGINLSQGICDLPLPSILAEGSLEAMVRGHNHYTRYDGIDELRQAIAAKVERFNGIKADPQREIVVCAGTTGAFYCACYGLLNPGDEVILFEPFYGYHSYTLTALDLVPVYAQLVEPDWCFSLSQLEQLITSRTRAMMINTPANPCGKVFTQQELEQLADFCVAHDLLVFTDEIYEYITFDGRQHISPGSLPQLAERTVTIGGYSKTYSITGWRIGYAIAPPAMANAIGMANDLLYICAPAPLQYGVAAAIERLPEIFYQEICQGYEEKRDLLCHTLEEVGMNPRWPQGAYYVLADASRLPGQSSKEKAIWLLEQAGIGTVPGEAFYHDGTGKNLLRFCFARDKELLQQACQRLRQLSL